MDRQERARTPLAGKTARSGTWLARFDAQSLSPVRWLTRPRARPPPLNRADLPPVSASAHNGAAERREGFVDGMRTFKRLGIGVMGVGALALASLWAPAAPPLQAQAQESKTQASSKQSVLGPGVYVYQQRVKEATCHDAEPDGYVLSFVAAIDGVPGATTMSMQITNTAYFKDWTLKISGNRVVGNSKIGKGADGPEAHFEVTKDGDRFKGTGHRSYNGSHQGKPQRCKVSYDALLKRLDV